MFYRLDGTISVVASGDTRPARDIPSYTHGATTGSAVTLKIVLDASNPSQYFFRAFADNYEFDLNGGTAGTAFQYGTSTAQRYIALTTLNNNAPANTVEQVQDFTLDFTPVPEPSVALLGLMAGTLACTRRKR